LAGYLSQMPADVLTLLIVALFLAGFVAVAIWLLRH
jgi:hypothetical protein